MVAGGWADTLVGVIGGGRLAGTGLCPYTGGVLIDDEPRDPLSCGTVRLDGLGERWWCCANGWSPRTVSSSVRLNVFLATGMIAIVQNGATKEWCNKKQTG